VPILDFLYAGAPVDKTREECGLDHGLSPLGFIAEKEPCFARTLILE